MFYMTHPHRRMQRMHHMHHLMEQAQRQSQASDRVRVPVDVRETDEAYFISAMLPGVDSEDVDIQVHDRMLTLKGEMKIGQDDDVEYLLREQPNGRFLRELRLPEPVDAEKIKAKLTNGVLTIEAAKSEEARPKTIKVLAK
jgi:HSP20 family protein